MEDPTSKYKHYQNTGVPQEDRIHLIVERLKSTCSNNKDAQEITIFLKKHLKTKVLNYILCKNKQPIVRGHLLHILGVKIKRTSRLFFSHERVC